MASYLARVLGPMRGAATSAMTVLKTKVPQVAGYEAKVVEAYTSTMTTVRTKVVPQTMEAYKTTMAENAEYVVKDPEAADKLGRQFIFTNMAKLPSMVEAAQAEVKVVNSKLLNIQNLPMTEVGVAALFSAEVFGWISVGQWVGGG